MARNMEDEDPERLQRAPYLPSNRPLRANPDPLLLVCRCFSLITSLAAIVCLVVNILSALQSFKHKPADMFNGIFRCYAVALAIIVVVAETEWSFVFKFWMENYARPLDLLLLAKLGFEVVGLVGYDIAGRVSDYIEISVAFGATVLHWTSGPFSLDGIGTTSVIAVLEYWAGRGMLQIFVAVMTRAYPELTGKRKDIVLLQDIASYMLLACGVTYIVSGVLCIGFLKRARQDKEISREQAVRDLEQLERRREELEQLLITHSA